MGVAHPAGAADAQGRQQLLLQVVLQVDALLLQRGGEHIGGDGVVAEHLAGHFGESLLEEGLTHIRPAVFAIGFLGLAGGHPQQVAQGQALQLLAGLDAGGSHFLGKDVDELLIQVNAPFALGNAHSHGGEGLR